ncbi:uncharacterized protein LOC144609350 isoform X2 [Rhinoraja longicauda]
MTSTTLGTADRVKNLEEFLGDMMILGTLQGFRYFQPWLRGREELLLSVANQDSGWQPAGFPGGPAISPGDGHQRSETPLDTLSPPEPPLSRRRSARGQSDGGHPPASPCDRELSCPGPDCTLFLVGCYARYGQPYAWVRSAHRRLPRAGDGDIRDTPLKLDSTAHWHSNAVLLWDVVAELVGLCTWPPPHNPFSVDLSHFHSLPPTLRFMATGAMAGFLQKLLLQGDRGQPYCTGVARELEAVNRLHLTALLELRRERGKEVEGGGGQDSSSASDSD